MQRRTVPLRIDLTIAVLLFAVAGLWGASSWKRAVVHGQPFYYQHYFEPAVMIACGKGFVISQPQLPAVVPFLQRRADSLSCDAIPAGANLGTEGLYQSPWRYLMFAVGYSWRLLGVSWSGLGPLFGALFGATIVAAYAIFRLGMSPLLAIFGSSALSVSSLHLIYLPQLRDYSKAPFTLALVFLLGLLVSRRATWKSTLAVAAAYGTVLGVGYGVRTDFLANIPPFFLTLAGFLEGGPFRNLRLKAAAAALCVATFLIVAWPIVSSVYKSGGCQWHTILLGFARQFSDPLGVEDAPYDANREYLDDYAYVNVTSYTSRVQPGVGHIEYCQPAYDRATARYLFEVVRTFPADMVVRSYASAMRIAELPFAPRLVTDAAGEPKFDYDRGHGAGIVTIVIALALAMAASVRIGLFLAFVLLYFGAYPALQFDPRHFFPLEFMAWWAFGFVLQTAMGDMRGLVRETHWDLVRRGAIRSAATLAACMAVLALLLWAPRAYQQAKVRDLLQRYVDAPKIEVPLAGLRPAPRTDPETAEFVEVDLNAWRCAPKTLVTFRYAEDQAARRPFSRVFTVPASGNFHDRTRIFMPVYDRFQGLDVSDTRPGCVDGVYRLHDLKTPLFLEVLLTPGWERSPLYQRLKGTGSGG